MDPGNWATDLEGGARFGYQLLWVLVVSNLMAILLQTLSARLGIIAQRDLAQACRESYPRSVSYSLWVLCEIAIAACDLAEVLGAAIALNLLFHIPLLIGVLITAADTLLILAFTRMGIRIIEAFILALIVTIAACFAVEIFWSGVQFVPMVKGLVPRLTNQSLYVAIGILGATVMPHNLYLHSALVQTRRIGKTQAERSLACRYNLVDSVIALNGALFVNAAILLLAAAVFFTRGIVVTEIQQAHVLLSPLVGISAAGVIFGIALLCSGQSSTLTGTMAGQIVMEGFLNFRMRPWLRRLITRTLAIIPAALTIYIAGDRGTYSLLILSQVILSLQLPFAVIPLIRLTDSRECMGSFRNAGWVRALSYLTAITILGLNVRLAWLALGDWIANSGEYRALLIAFLLVVLTALTGLLAWITFGRLIHTSSLAPPLTAAPPNVAQHLEPPHYSKILVPLDHSAVDRAALSHAVAFAKTSGAVLYLLHVEEGVTSQVYGAIASTAEVEADTEYLREIADSLRSQGVLVRSAISHSQNPRAEIVRYAREVEPDLIVMGAHGHKGISDIIFGTTINSVRHHLTIPVLLVRRPQA